MEKVVVALSGGVDSAVVAALLKQKGYLVQAVHMQNWDPEINEEFPEIREEKGCVNKEDLRMVRRICDLLEIPLRVYSFVPEYWEEVFENYISNIKQNLNTNPDISCNSKIKFGVLLKRIKLDFGEDMKLATGHWARIIWEGDKCMLGVCENKEKDQTYFLSSLTQEQLENALFPLAEIKNKQEIRELAKMHNLPNWDKRDSTGICFIGKRDYQEFMSQYVQIRVGNFVSKETGKIVGKHKGVNFYVLHQSSGLGISGMPEKQYVCGKNATKNIVYVCGKSNIEKFLYKTKTICVDLHFIHEPFKKGEYIYIKPRHTVSFVRAKVLFVDKEKCILEHEKMYVTSPGQSVVFYDSNKNICLGNGMYILENCENE